MDADVAARQGEGIDTGVVHDEEGEIALAAAADRDQLVAQLVEIGFGHRIVEVARIGIDVAQYRAAQRLFFLIGEVLARNLAEIRQVGCCENRRAGKRNNEQGTKHRSAGARGGRGISFTMRELHRGSDT